ncbi:S8 family serine peptidase [Thermococcus sp.]|uniref:S8 family serine peptidase n=1 Tax=Thermococcus sp. TaxID=35749 RepID=UPI0026355129|nr:S8 family serine peptidase [Thermococcus sp.]
MNRKAASLIIVVVMVLSLVPALLPPTTATSAVAQNSPPRPSISVERVSSPTQNAGSGIVSSTLKDLVKLVYERYPNQGIWVPFKVVSAVPVKIQHPGIRVVGSSEIAGDYVYLVMLKSSPTAVGVLDKIAQIPGVLEVSPLSDVKPLVAMLSETSKPTVADYMKVLSTSFKGKLLPGMDFVYKTELRTPTTLNGFKVLSFRELAPSLAKVSPEVMASYLEAKEKASRFVGENYPVPKPNDIFSTIDVGALKAWSKYGITGEGIHVAVIDSGVDFGNPDLSDTYAVETNPNSPYYGWPIAFDSASMLEYLLFGGAFPNLFKYPLYWPWYSNTSLFTGIPMLFRFPYVLGYRGTNFTVAFSGMSLANIPNTTARAELINEVLQYLFNGTPTGRILLVDDDNGPDNNGTLWYDFDSYYTSALDLLGYNYTLYRVVNNDRPNYTVLKNYSAVIWFTGMNNESFTAEQLGNISEYLDSGGKLFLISTNFLDTNGFYIPANYTWLINQTNVTAPPTGNYTFYSVTINSTVDKFVVNTTAANASLDVDLYVLYNGSIVGISARWGPNESVVINNPQPGQYLIVVYSYDNPGNLTYNIVAYTVKYGTPQQTDFNKNYLHVSNSTYYLLNLGIPSVGMDSAGTFRVEAVNRGAVNVTEGYIGIPYYYLDPSTTDFQADPTIPGANATVLTFGYMALPVNFSRGILMTRLPLNLNLTLPFEGPVHIGMHPDLALAVINTPPDSYYINPAFVLVVDSNGDGTYDKVYVDLTTDWGNLVDFNEDSGHTKANPVVAWDLFKTTFVPGKGAVDVPGKDGYADISGGLIYFIADGKTPIPYSTVVAQRWGLPLRIPGNGGLVAFMIGSVFAGGLEHGTLCAAAIAAQGRTVGPEGLAELTNTTPNFFYPVVGDAINARIIAEGDLYTMMSNWLDLMYFATEGYDGVPGTGDEAQITSNSYGMDLMYVYDRGFNFEDRFLKLLSLERPFTVHFFAAGNEGPGYGTDSSNGASPGVITVGAATEFGYRVALGWNAVDEHGDVADFSSRGPNALGQVKPDILATGEFALGSTTLNMQAWRSTPIIGGVFANEVWAGTSLATPTAAGVGALVAEAFYMAHGRYPTLQEMRSILMSAAENTYNDVFEQGAGYINATKAVEIALGIGGIEASPSKWQAGAEYDTFPGVLYPGESAAGTFTLTNYYNTSVTVNITPGVVESIGRVEIPIYNVSSNFTSWPFLNITGLIPNGTQLMKVTVYPTASSGSVAMLVRVYGDYGLIQQGGTGETVWFTVKEPLERSPDVYLQVRQYGTGTFNGTIVLQFYRISPWKLVNVTPETIQIPAKSSVQFKATVTVPENASYGIYEGAIYVDYPNGTVTIPVSIVVGSPEADFTFGGVGSAGGLYDNANLYSGQGYGDWRLFYFNVSQENATNGFIVSKVIWNDWAPVYQTILQPYVDGFSMNMPGIFGPYTLRTTKELGDITFSGTGLENILVSKAVPGLNALWVFAPYGGTKPAINFVGHVGIMKLSPQQWTEVRSLTSSKTFSLYMPEWLGTPVVHAYGFGAPIEYLNQLAPNTSYSNFYTVNVTNTTTLLDVWTESVWDTIAGLDIDLYVYYNDNGTWELVGSSTSPTADEHVVLYNPRPGQYIIEVYSWENPAPGQATYNLYVTLMDSELTATAVPQDNGHYKVVASYALTESQLKGTEPLYGLITIGVPEDPELLTIPVKLLPASPIAMKADVDVIGTTINGTFDLGGQLTFTAFVVNNGPFNASNVTIMVYENGRPTTLSTTIPVMKPFEVYRIKVTVPLLTPGLKTFTLRAQTLDDVDLANSQVSVFVKPVIPEQFNATYDLISGVSGVSVERFVSLNGRYVMTIDGPHGAEAVAVFKLPSTTTSYAVLPVSNIDILKVWTENTTDGILLYVKVKLHSPGTLAVDYTTPSTLNQMLVMLSYMYYHNYVRYNQTFTELYANASAMGVSNETLALAEALYQNATMEFQKVMEISNGNLWGSLGDFRVFIHLRLAYVDIKKAVTILEEAIAKVQGS